MRYRSKETLTGVGDTGRKSLPQKSLARIQQRKGSSLIVSLSSMDDDDSSWLSFKSGRKIKLDSYMYM